MRKKLLKLTLVGVLVAAQLFSQVPMVQVFAESAVEETAPSSDGVLITEEPSSEESSVIEEPSSEGSSVIEEPSSEASSAIEEPSSEESSVIEEPSEEVKSEDSTEVTESTTENEVVEENSEETKEGTVITDSTVSGNTVAPIKEYTVTFIDTIAEVSISEVVVKEGKAAEAPQAPEHEGFEFVGWSAEFNEVLADMTVNAEYMEIIGVSYPKFSYSETVGGVEISLTAEEGVLPEGTTVEITAVNKDIKDIIESSDNSIKVTSTYVFEINLYDADGNMIEPAEGTVMVDFSNVLDDKAESLKVYYVNEDKVEDLATSENDGNISFDAEHFSTYAVAGVSYDTSTGTLIENEYATAYRYDDTKVLLITEFKKNGTSVKDYPWCDKAWGYSLEFADTVTFIGDYAFQGQMGFKGNLEVPSTVKSIGEGAFDGANFTGDLVVPASITSISANAFSGIEVKGNLILPSSVTSIGDNAFSYASFSGDLKIPDEIITLGGGAFKHASFTGSLKIPDSVKTWGHDVFGGAKFVGDLVIPASMTAVKDGVFSGINVNGSLKIPNSVTEIESAAFWGASFTGVLQIPDSVTSIGSNAFTGASFTGDLKIPNSIKTWGANVFSSAKFTGRLILPDSIEVIKTGTFHDASFTGWLIIPRSVKTIKEMAFYNCSGFTGELIIPDSVTSIEDSAFQDCTGFTGDLVIANSVTSIGASAFSGCSGFTGDLIIPDSVTEIGARAFGSCSGFTGDLVIPNSVTSIGALAFDNCTNIGSKLVIPDSVTTIGLKAFAGCDSITDITIGNGVASIPNGVFMIYSFSPAVGVKTFFTTDNTAIANYDFVNSNRTIMHKVSFNSNGGTPVPTQVIQKDNFVTEPADPTKEGYTFGGWYKDPSFNNIYDFSNKVSSGFILYAKWTSLAKDYSVSFNSNGGTPVPTQVVQKDNFVTEPAEPTKNGHCFIGWYTDEAFTNQYDFSSKVSSNITLYAKYLEYFTVSFETDGGSSIAPLTILDGYYVIKPTRPTKKGYSFDGWYKDSACKQAWNFTSNKVKGNVTLYAKWFKNSDSGDGNGTGGDFSSPIATFYVDSKIYEVTGMYYSGGGDGDTVSPMPPAVNPKKVGYTFKGWNCDGAENIYDITPLKVKESRFYRLDELIDFSDAVTFDDLIFFAVFEKNAGTVETTFKIIDKYYDADGVSLLESSIRETVTLAVGTEYSYDGNFKHGFMPLSGTPHNYSGVVSKDMQDIVFQYQKYDAPPPTEPAEPEEPEKPEPPSTAEPEEPESEPESDSEPETEEPKTPEPVVKEEKEYILRVVNELCDSNGNTVGLKEVLSKVVKEGEEYSILATTMEGYGISGATSYWGIVNGNVTLLFKYIKTAKVAEDKADEVKKDDYTITVKDTFYGADNSAITSDIRETKVVADGTAYDYSALEKKFSYIETTQCGYSDKRNKLIFNDLYVVVTASRVVGAVLHSDVLVEFIYKFKF